MNTPFAVILVAASTSVLSGCPAGQGSADYSPSHARVVEPVREVNTEGTKTPLGAGAGAVAGGAAQADAATETLVEAGHLDARGAARVQRGERTERNANGDLLLFPPSDQSATEPTQQPATATSTQAGPPSDQSATEPTQQPATAASTQAGTGDVTIPSGDLGRLGRELTQRGWRTERNANGDLLVFPPSDQSATEPTQQPATTTSTQAGTGDVTIPSGDLGRLGRELTQRGWRTERNANGDLLLFPPSDQSATEPTQQPATATSTQAGTGDVTIPSGDLGRLGRELTQRGWRTERNANGDLLLFPIGDAP